MIEKSEGRVNGTFDLPPNLLRIGKRFQSPIAASEVGQRFAAGSVAVNRVAGVACERIHTPYKLVPH